MQLTIDRRFCGPSSSGNGGWTSGSLAQAFRAGTGVTGPVTVRLTAPPPLERPLDVVIAGPDDGPRATLLDGASTIATATPGSWASDPVPFVTPEAAAATATSYVAPHQHPFPHCFVCGPAREPGDGMRLTPGHLPGGGTACVWRPADVVGDGSVTEPYVWSALDCPGGWASDFLGRPMVLGTMTAQVLAPPSTDQTTVVTGRLDRTEGRRSWTSSALWSDDGDLLARAEAVWVEIDPAVFNTILG